MQDENKLLSALDTTNHVSIGVAIMTLVAQSYGLLANPPKSFYYYLGLMMMATSVAFVVSGAIRAVLGKIEGRYSATVVGFLAFAWFANGAVQFGLAAFRH